METQAGRSHGSVGQYLEEKVFGPLGLSVADVADAIQVPPNRLYQIMNGDREVTVDTAVRLGHYFGTGPEMWLYLQMQQDLAEFRAEHPDLLADIQPYASEKFR